MKDFDSCVNAFIKEDLLNSQDSWQNLASFGSPAPESRIRSSRAWLGTEFWLLHLSRKNAWILVNECGMIDSSLQALGTLRKRSKHFSYLKGNWLNLAPLHLDKKIGIDSKDRSWVRWSPLLPSWWRRWDLYPTTRWSLLILLPSTWDWRQGLGGQVIPKNIGLEKMR